MGNTIVVTGGAGYIGSHAVLALLRAGYRVVVIDNLCNSEREAISRVAEVAGISPEFEYADVRDEHRMREILARSGAVAVMHFAGLKSVADSFGQAVEYYDVNVSGTIALVKAMERVGIRRLVFSSSATVYGIPASLPITEDHGLSAINPYGATKLVVENFLRDLHAADPSWRIGILRYFNPVGADESGRIGEDPLGAPGNLMPLIAQVAMRKRERLNVYGGDYPTADGTGVRDFIHVVDLAEGHLCAARRLERHEGVFTVNLGTGRGYSVLQVLREFERENGVGIPYDIVGRRPGDVAACYADVTLAKSLLGWQAARTLTDMCRDVWRWQTKNPEGYKSGHS